MAGAAFLAPLSLYPSTLTCPACLFPLPLPPRYRMDYMRFVQHHIETGADITIGCIPYDESRASDFGLMKIDGQVGGCWGARGARGGGRGGGLEPACLIKKPNARMWVGRV